MNKQEIIIELLKSLNKGNGGVLNDRVAWAISQYNELVKKGIINDTTT